MLTPHQKAALNYKDHVALTANAGSGKTLVLARRYLEIALNEPVRLKNIAAITFTDKAAGELQKKIALELENRISAGQEEPVKRKLEDIRRQLVSANISTIHSFCVNILREFPVEANIDAKFTPIDENSSYDLIELSVEETIKEHLLGENAGKLKKLIRTLGSKDTFSKELISLIKNRKNVYQLKSKIYNKDENEIAERFNASFWGLIECIFFKRNDIFNLLINIAGSAFKHDSKFSSALELKSRLNSFSSENSPERKLELLLEIKDLICTKGKYPAVRSDYKKKAEEYKEHFVHIESFFDSLKNILYPGNHKNIELELARFGKDIIYFFNIAADKYEDKKREGGVLDYEDILLYTQNLLSNDSVIKSLSSRYKYLMIDEYQDTNELQYNIFLPVLDYLKKGNLFVVGDEKQSIYMFRDAELEVFSRTKDDIKTASSPGDILNLPDSFRMAPNLCGFTNVLFRNLFNQPDTLFNEVEHSDLVCARSTGVKGNVEIILAGSEENEAALAARKIIEITSPHSGFGFKWNDIAILCRKRKSFSALEKEFIKYNIPFSIVGGIGFFQQQVIYDIYNYFSFLLDNFNDTALAGILRSPFFHVKDSELYEISQVKGKSLFEKLVEYSGTAEKLQVVVNILKNNISIIHSEEIIYILRKILRETQYLSVISSRINGTQQLANIEKLIKLTTKFKSQGFKTLYDYVNYLKVSIENAEDEAQAALADETNSVKILTLHQAKGLEYPAVILFNCHDISRKDDVKSKSIMVDKIHGLLTKVPLDDNYFGDYHAAPLLNAVNIISARKNMAELKRLFYVGVTRAKDYLCISAAEMDGYPASSFMGMLIKSIGKLDKEQITIDTKIPVLEKNDESFENKVVEVKFDIPIIKSLPSIQASVPEVNMSLKPLINIRSIDARSKEEIISATKMSVYKQCPIKYKLVYEYGITPVLKEYKNRLNYPDDILNVQLIKENEEKEQDTENILIREGINAGELKGRIIHKILQEGIIKKDLEKEIKKNISIELSSNLFNTQVEEKLVPEILNSLNYFYSSKIYNWLNEQTAFKNEFEIYVKQDDFYLYGIIDRIILAQDKLVIIDYKTDDIPFDQLKSRAEQYFTQLKFYSYISSRVFENYSNLELRLVFIKFPDSEIKWNENRDGLEAFADEIRDMVKKIRSGDYIPNLKGCERCPFSTNNYKCIIDIKG